MENPYLLKSLRIPKDLCEWIGEQAEKEERSWNQTTMRILELARKKDMAKQQSKEKDTANV